MKITKNFDSDEFKCHDGTTVPSEYHCNLRILATNLQVIRAAIGKPLSIVSGYRTASWNKKIGGAPKSQHLTASAADIKTVGMTPRELHKEILSLIKQGYIHDGGVGLYNGFVHYDIRETPTRWNFDGGQQ